MGGNQWENIFKTQPYQPQPGNFGKRTKISTFGQIISCRTGSTVDSIPIGPLFWNPSCKLGFNHVPAVHVTIFSLSPHIALIYYYLFST